MSGDKTCPRCPNSLPMKKVAGLSTLPGHTEKEKPVSVESGITVQAYLCSACGLIDLYQA